MDSDICHLDVDQGLHMPLSEADTCHQSTHQATRCLNRLLDTVECDHHHPMDRTVPTCRRGLEFKFAGFMFLQRSARENSYCPSQ